MLDIPKHKMIMYKLIIDIFTSKIAPKIAFKGGTLAFFHYELDRFSTDIDIDLLEGKITQDIKDTLEDLLPQYGDWKKDYENEKIGMRYKVNYGEIDLNIKIEFNTRIFPHNKYEVINFRGISIKAMEKSTMFANKLIALVDRPSMVMRDLWDIHFFFKKGFDINKDVILDRLQFDEKYKKIKKFQQFLQYTYNFIQKNISSRYIVDANLGIVLSEKQKARAKKQLLAETLAFLEIVMGK